MASFYHPFCSFNATSRMLFTLIVILLVSRAFSSEISQVVTPRCSEKTTHLHFYFHDTLSGKNPSAVKIAQAKGDSSMTSFGTTFVMDDPLTEGPEKTSKVVGRAQGIYSLASQKFPELLMVVNYKFTRGLYNRSSISVLGRNPVMNDVREMPIVGGTGLFRLARGYALAHTFWYDPNTGDAIVEYNAYVMHS